MDHNQREKAIFDYIANDDWDRAIEHAKAIPANHDIWQRLPSASEGGMPNSAINKVLDHLGKRGLNHSGFLYEMANNFMGHHNAETLPRLAHTANDNGQTHFETNAFTSHPNYELTEGQKHLARAHQFWKQYEKEVKPSHFAAIKSLFSGQPEKIKHRGQEGASEDHHEAMPSLHDYAAKIQDKIMNDDDIHKRYYNGEPYIKVHRGVGGHYSKMIRDAANYNEKTGEYDHKNLAIPTAPFSS